MPCHREEAPGHVPIEEYDSSARQLVPEGATLEPVATGFVWTGGPVWCGGRLLFADVSRDRIVCWRMRSEGPEVTAFRHPRGHARGLTLDRGGRLVACGSGLRRITRTEPDGSFSVLAERYDGGRLNSPNHVVVGSDGSIYFTDPGGACLARIRMPAFVANLAWGDSDWQSLFIACQGSVYRLILTVPGVPVPS